MILAPEESQATGAGPTGAKLSKEDAKCQRPARITQSKVPELAHLWQVNYRFAILAFPWILVLLQSRMHYNLECTHTLFRGEISF